MATRRPTDHAPHDALPGETEIARLYRDGGHDMPPPALDAMILEKARKEVRKSNIDSAFTRRLRFAVPLSTAAVVVLAVGVVLLMNREGALDRDGSLNVPSEYSTPSTSEAWAPASPTMLADTREAERAAEPAKAKRAAPEPATPAAVAESAENKLVKQMPVAALKKAEAPAATAPPIVGQAQETDRLTIAREEKTRARPATAGVAAMKTQGADVVAVRASGSPGAYSFNVTVKSPDTGCQQYADWWEVLSEDGKLLYRRVLAHSHVDEQPFERSGGPVPVQPETVVWVRAHMNTTGYGGVLFRGSVKGGFTLTTAPANFAAGVAKQPPLPDGCAF